MRERYIEEQMFSDKIRSASTMWTYGLILTHLGLFCAVQFWVEPKKKTALVDEVARVVQRSVDAAAARIDARVAGEVEASMLKALPATTGDTTVVSASIQVSEDGVVTSWWSTVQGVVFWQATSAALAVALVLSRVF